MDYDEGPLTPTPLGDGRPPRRGKPDAQLTDDEVGANVFVIISRCTLIGAHA